MPALPGLRRVESVVYNEKGERAAGGQDTNEDNDGVCKIGAHLPRMVVVLGPCVPDLELRPDPRSICFPSFLPD